MADDPARRNYLAFLFEGAFFIGGVGFVNGQTLLPGIIIQENGPTWLAALAPSMMIVGLFGAPAFTARKVDRLPRMKPIVLKSALAMRVVYLMATILFLMPFVKGLTSIWILALTPLLAGICGGLGIVAWQRLFTTSVASKLRPSNIALRFLLGGLLGIVAGKTIEWALDSFPLITAFAVLHGIAFGFMTLSLIILATVREPETPAQPVPSPEAPPSFRKTALLEGFQDLLGQGPGRRGRISFFLSVVLMHGLFVTTPFFAAHLLQVLDKPTRFLGILAMWQMIGMATGNLLAAWTGARWGGRFTMALGTLGVAITLQVVPLVNGVSSACAVYAAYSTAIMLMVVGKDSLVLDFSPATRQSRYLTAMGVTTMLSILATSLLGYLLYHNFGNFTVLAGAGTVATLGSFVTVSYVPEPRNDVKLDPLRALYRGVFRYFR